ncbi:hypothetical protein EIP86_006786 [Pleurotus ostreatoroseus]|nr:hypothetical protein EIP86_006786 [Pleurotus ostreatoroseus]
MVALTQKLLHSADGTKIYAEAAGDPSKPALVFIHGLGLCTFAFDAQFEDPRLNQTLYLVRYDMRGHGQSGMPLEKAAYESARHAEDFKVVCGAFGLVKPSVLAWSLGAAITMGFKYVAGTVVVDVIEAYSADYLGSIIYCGGALLTRALHNDYIHPHLSSLVPEILSMDADVIAATAHKFVESIVEDVDNLFPHRDQVLWAGVYLSMLPTARVHLVTRTQNYGRWEKEIKGKQVLIIQGTHDRHARAEGLVETAKKWLGPFELKLLEGCGHSPVFERPKEVNGYIASFIQKTVSV